MESPRAGSAGRAAGGNSSGSRRSSTNPCVPYQRNRHHKSLTGGPSMEAVHDKPRMRSETHTFRPDSDRLHLELVRGVHAAESLLDQSSTHRHRAPSICSGSARNNDASRTLRPPLLAGDFLPRTRILLKGQGIYLRDFFAERRGVLFGGPGAFTPTCSERHLVGFRDQSPQIKAAGIDFIGCIYSNDPFVLKAWARSKRVHDHFTFISDVEGRLASALGVLTRSRARGLGHRPRRFAMIIGEGGRVQWSNVDNDCFAEDVLKFLGVAPAPVTGKDDLIPPVENTYGDTESSEGPVADDSSSETISEAAAEEVPEEFSSQEILIGRWRALIMEASVRVDDLTKIPLASVDLGRGAPGDQSVSLNYNTTPSQHTISHTTQGIRVSVEIGHGLDGFGILRFDGRNYIATEFHLVGPSPHVLDAKPSFHRPVELRIVHQAAPDQKDTSRSQLLVLAVTFGPPPLTASERDNVLAINPFLGQVLEIPTLAPDIYEVFQVGRRALPGGGFNLNELIPTDASFFNYKGVLSALGERVTWLVMKQSLSLSRLQLHALERYCPSSPCQVHTPCDAFALAHVYRFLPKLKNIRAQTPAVIIEALRKKMYVMTQLESSMTYSVLCALSADTSDISNWLFAFRHKLEEQESELADLKGLIDKALEAYPVCPRELETMCRATDSSGEIKSTYLSRFLVPDDVARLCKALDECEVVERGVRVGTMSTGQALSVKDHSPRQFNRSVTAPGSSMNSLRRGSHSSGSGSDRFPRPRFSHSGIETERSLPTSSGSRRLDFAAAPTTPSPTSRGSVPSRKGLHFSDAASAEPRSTTTNTPAPARSVMLRSAMRSSQKPSHPSTASSSSTSDGDDPVVSAKVKSSSSDDEDTVTDTDDSENKSSSSASVEDENPPSGSCSRSSSSRSKSASESSSNSLSASTDGDDSDSASDNSSSSASSSAASSSSSDTAPAAPRPCLRKAVVTDRSQKRAPITKLAMKSNAAPKVKSVIRVIRPVVFSSASTSEESKSASTCSEGSEDGVDVASTQPSDNETSSSEAADTQSSSVSSQSASSENGSNSAGSDETTSSECESQSESASNSSSSSSSSSTPRARKPCRKGITRNKGGDPAGLTKSSESRSMTTSSESICAAPSRPPDEDEEPEKIKKGALKQGGVSVTKSNGSTNTDASNRQLTEAQVELAQFMMKKLKRSSSAECNDDVTTANTAANLKSTQITSTELAALHRRDQEVKRLQAKGKGMIKKRLGIRFDTDAPKSAIPIDPAAEEEWSALDRKRDREIRLRRRKPTGHPNLGDQVAKMLIKMAGEKNGRGKGQLEDNDGDEGPRYQPPALTAQPKRGALKALPIAPRAGVQRPTGKRAAASGRDNRAVGMSRKLVTEEVMNTSDTRGSNKVPCGARPSAIRGKPARTAQPQAVRKGGLTKKQPPPPVKANDSSAESEHSSTSGSGSGSTSSQASTASSPSDSAAASSSGDNSSRNDSESSSNESSASSSSSSEAPQPRPKKAVVKKKAAVRQKQLVSSWSEDESSSSSSSSEANSQKTSSSTAETDSDSPVTMPARSSKTSASSASSGRSVSSRDCKMKPGPLLAAAREQRAVNELKGGAARRGGGLKKTDQRSAMHENNGELPRTVKSLSLNKANSGSDGSSSRASGGEQWTADQSTSSRRRLAEELKHILPPVDTSPASLPHSDSQSTGVRLPSPNAEQSQTVNKRNVVVLPESSERPTTTRSLEGEEVLGRQRLSNCQPESAAVKRSTPFGRMRGRMASMKAPKPKFENDVEELRVKLGLI